MRSALAAFVVRGGKVPVASLVGVALLVILAGVLVLASIGIGLAAVYLWLREPLGPAPAMSATAGITLLLAGLLLVMARRTQSRTRVPGAAEIATNLVRQYPLESAAAALAAGLAVGGSERARKSLASALSSSLNLS